MNLVLSKDTKLKNTEISKTPVGLPQNKTCNDVHGNFNYILMHWHLNVNQLFLIRHF